MEFILHLIIILLVAYLAGRFFEMIRLTKIIGYIIVGIVVGPSLINWYTEAMIASFDPLITFALALIAFFIGSRLLVPEIKKMERQIFEVTFFQAFLTFFSVMLFSFIFMRLFSVEHSLPIAIMLGAIAMATAPATVFAIVEEFRAKGPLTTLLLAIVAIDDVIAIVMYSLLLGVADFFLAGMKDISAYSLLLPLRQIAWPALIGIVMGGLFIFVTKKIKEQTLCLVCLAILLVLLPFLSEYLRISPLIAAMILGFMAINFNSLKEETIARLGGIEELIFIFFFVTAGAGLKIDVLFQVGLLAIVYVLARWAGKVLGGGWGARLSGAEKKVQRWLGWSLLPQAGVAIAFVHLTSKLLPQIAGPITAIVLASIVLDEIIGPLGVELAVFRAGEARKGYK